MKILLFPTTLLFFFCGFSFASDIERIMAEVNRNIQHIDTNRLKKMIDNQEDFVLIDVRMPSEIARMGSIDAPQNREIPRGWLEIRIGHKVKDKNTPIVTYCGGGIRSALAADTLQKMGYTHVRNYKTGFLGWEGAGLDVTYHEAHD